MPREIVAPMCYERYSNCLIALCAIALTLARSENIPKEIERSSDAPRRPHILFILADDFGYNDVSYHQNSVSPPNPKGRDTTNVVVETPNIDRLAASGRKLESYYVTPLCSPTRGTIMTGRYPSHTGIGPQVIKPTEPYGMPARETLLPEMLRSKGYSTHMVGKWHLGLCDSRYTPTFRGFESYFGYLLGAEDYFEHTRTDSKFTALDLRNSTLPDSTEQLPPVYHGAKGIYSTDIFVERVRDVVNIAKDGDRPLFLYVPFQSVHGPLQVPQSYVKRYPESMDKDRRTYAGMVSALDDAVGQIESIFIEAGMWNSTVTIFSTDNGGPLGSANNYPLRGHKNTAWEGGVRGVGFVRGTFDEKMPTTFVPPGTYTTELMHSTDWFPTIESIATGGGLVDSAEGVEHMDGFDQWSCIARNEATSRNVIVHNCPASNSSSMSSRAGAIRVGKYKLLFDADIEMQVPADTPQTPPPGFDDANTGLTCQAPKAIRNMWLFDIEKDPRECENIVGKNETLLQSILAVYDTYRKTAVGDLALEYVTDEKANPALNADGAWGPWAERSEMCKWAI